MNKITWKMVYNFQKSMLLLIIFVHPTEEEFAF